MRRVLLFFSVVLCLTATLKAQSPKPAEKDPAARPSPAASASTKAATAARASFAKLPLSFEENAGQTDGRAQYTSRGAGYNLFLTPDEAVFALHGASTAANCAAPPEKIHPGCADSRKQSREESVLWLKMLGANASAQAAGEDPLPGKINYYVGNNPAKWRTGVRQFARVSYKEIYPGVDLTYYGNQRQLESDYVVAPGADPRSIEFEVRGARETRLDGQGNLVLVTGVGNVQLLRPGIYQLINGKRHAVSGRYVMRSGNRVAFSIGPYDRREKLIIDPTLVYSTYLGGSALSSGDMAQAIAIDSAGHAYVTGQGTSADFPGSDTAGPPVEELSDFVFVTEFDPTGSSAGAALVYSTILSGSTGYSNTSGNGIGLDSSGNAYIAGTTEATDFPMVNPYQATYGAAEETGFVAGLNSTGTLIYSTYLGGRNESDSSELQGLFADTSGNAYVVGDTTSPNFPTIDPLQATLNGYQNVVVAKFNNQGQPAYISYLGGNGYDYGTAITADSSGNAYLTGYTSSTNFPLQTSPAPFQSALNGGYDLFITKLSFSGSALTLANSTYLGGSSSDEGMGIAIDTTSPPNVYLTGQTDSSGTAPSGFPTTTGAFSTTNAGGTWDAFVTKLNGTFSALVYSTYLGGSGADIGYGIRLDGSDDAYVTGSTTSANFPTKLPLQSALGSSTATNVFLTELNTTGTALTYSTYLGGTGVDDAYGIAVDLTGNAYITGKTTSANFPVLSGGAAGTSPYQGQLGGTAGNAFVATVSPAAAAAALNFFPPSYNFHDAGIGASGTEVVTLSNNTSASASVSGFVFGGADSGDFTLTAATTPCTTTGSFTLAAGASCSLTLVFTPQDQDTRSATLTVNYNSTSSSVMSLTGSGGAPEVSLSSTSITFSNDPLNVSEISGVTITNTGGAPLQIGSAQISASTPAQAAPFSAPANETSCYSAPLAPGASCSIDVYFVPTAAGSYSATLLINSNAAGSPATLTMSGTGVQEVLVEPTSALELGLQVVGSTSTNNENEAYLVNGSGETINLTVTPGTGADQGDFHINTPNGENACSTVGQLAPGGTCYLLIYFQPQAASATDGRTGSYTIAWTGTTIASIVPGSQVVNVMGTGVTGISLYQTSITAPSDYVGFSESSAGLEYLYNGTANPITVAIALSGNNPGDFSAQLDSTCAPGGVVPANTYCNVDVSFSPSALGLRTATVTFTYTGASNGTLTLNGSGTGIPGPVEIFTNADGYLEEVGSASFGSEIIGTTTPVKSFQLRNVATAPLTIQSFTGPANADFKVVSNTCVAGTVPAGGSCFLGITFTPSTTAAETTTFVITDAYTSTNGTDAASPHTVTLTGTGEAAAITVSVSSGGTNLLDFGNIALNPSPIPQAEIFLTNAGSTPTTISWTGGSPVLTTSGTPFGLVASGQNVTTCTQGKQVLPQGGSCLIGVTFDPTAAGEQTNSVTFSDSVGGSHTVNIQGNGAVQGKVSFSPTSLTFTQVPTNPAAPGPAQTVTLTNTGTGPLTITSASLLDNTSSQYAIASGTTCTAGDVIAASGTCIFKITFTAPSTTGTYYAYLYVQTSLGNNATSSNEVELTGTSVSGGFLLNPAGPINFGAVAVGTTVTSTEYTLTNENTTSVTFPANSITVPTGYSVAYDGCSSTTETSGNSCYFEITFAPTSGTANYNGNASFAFTGPSGSPYTVALEGSGSTSVVANPNPVTFQYASVGNPSDVYVTITNGSASQATITSVNAITGSSTFSIPYNSCPSGAILTASGGSCLIEIQFQSSTAGTFIGQFTVSYTIGGVAQTPVTVNLSATISSALAVILTPASGGPLTFLSQTVNTQSQVMSVVVENSPSSTQSLSFTGFQISGANGNDFALGPYSSTWCQYAYLSAGQSCTIPIIFTPSAAGTRTGTLTITDNSSTPMQTVTLTGSGEAGTVSAAPNPLPFPTTNVGSSVTLGAVFSNTTGSAVKFNSVAFTGPYSIDNGAGACVNGSTVSAVTGTCVVYIKFTPTGASNAGTATISYGTSGATVVIPLSGTGSNPIVSVSPTSLTFTGLQLVGTQSSPMPVTLTNGTTSSITISSMPSVSGDFLLGTYSCTSGATITAGSSCSVNVIFKPTTTGTRTGTLQIVDATDPNSPHNVSLSGTGTTPSTIAATTGTPQSIVVNSAFSALTATVKDSNGNALPGVSVTFTITAASGGASGTFTGNLTSATVTTGSNGVATAPTLTANNIPGGPFTVAATAGGIGPATFSLTNLAGTPASITATSGTPQSVAINTAFASLQVTVKDSNSLPLDGVTVTFTAPSSGASGTFAGGTNGGTTVTAVTNTSGVATAPTFTANGTAGGPYNVTATATGAGPADFSLTNLAGAPASVTATTGTPQSAVIGVAFATNLAATVKDSSGNLLSGVVVAFTSPSSGASGTFAGGTSGGTTVNATTNASGVATASLFTANTTAGVYVVNASVTGVSNKAAYSLTNTAGPPATILATAGTPQSAAVTAAFATNLAATVTDSGGNPISGATVTFTAPSSGASGTFAGGTNGGTTVTATTGATGVATASVFTANSTIGSYTVTAAVTGVSTKASFSLTNTAGPAASITATAGTPQSATVSAAFSTALQATVKDAGGNPVTGATVTFKAPSTGASGTFTGGTNGGATITATTNSSGVATAATFTANTVAGSYTVTASVTGVTATASFSMTNTAGAAASVTATAGTPQSATIGTAFATNLAATVKDADGNLVSGATVTFTSPSSGASGAFAGGTSGGTTLTATTNASGVATATAFTANTVAGAYTVNASVTGVTAKAAFSLTNNAGAAASVTATAGTPQNTTISTAFGTNLAATVKDASGNLVNGATVTFTAPSTGASGTFTGGTNGGLTVTATTNASGVATAPVFTANKTAGTYTVNATVTGVGTAAAFSLTNNVGAAATITATSGASQSVAINTAFAAMAATVEDSGGNGVSGVSVTFTVTAAGNGASGTFTGGVTTATVTTNASGIATAPTFTANSTAGGPYTVAAKAGSIGPANFSLTNLSAPPAKILATAGSGQSIQISTAFATALQATVEDSNSLPISGATVTFTAPSTGASGIFTGGTNGGLVGTAVTNSSGVATAPAFTANSVAGGPYNVVASAGTVSVNFAETNLPGPAASITATGGATQSVTIGTAFAALQATVKDSGGNPVNNATVTFTAPSSGASGTFTGGTNGGTTITATTNASGVATAATFTADTVAGSYSVTAAVTGISTKASYSLTNLPGPASKIVVTTGGSQSVAVNTAFSALAVTVTDASGNGVSGTSVTFTAPSSGASGTFTGGTNGGLTAVVTSNASGIATAPTFTANNTVGGPYTIAASSSGLTTVDFSLTNLAGTPASVTATSGATQSVAVNTAFATLVANVKDSHSNPLSGVVVTFTAPSSGASGTFAGGTNGGTTVTATTDVNGNATAPTFTANSTAGGPYTVTAVAGALAPANFSLTNLAGAPASVTATAGATQSAVISTAFATNLGVTVKDSDGNLLSGVIVTFTAPSSGASGTFAGGTNGGLTVTATTGSNGVAAAPVFTANATVGAFAVNATVTGVATPAMFSLTNTAGPPASVTATAGTPQSVTISKPFATVLAATVKDSGGNPINGVTVTFTAPSTGASGTFTGGTNGGITVTATTNASGVATAAVFSANGTAGAYTVNATVTGVSTPAAFSLTNLAGPPASIAATAGTPQSAPVTTAFTTALQATVKDSGGNLVSGASVTFTAPSTGASGTFTGGTNGGLNAVVTTNSSGVATAPAFTANATGGAYNVTASVTGVATNATFALTNTVAPNVTISKSHAGDFVVGSNGIYTIKLTNSGTGPTTGTVTVTDPLPAGLTLVSGTSATAGWTCTANGQTVTCTNASAGVLAASGSNSTSTISLTVSVAPDAISSPTNFSLTNSATVSDPGDTGTTGKSVTDTATNIDNAVPTETSFSPSTGLIAGATSAQAVTITGTGLNSSTQVTLGSNAPLTGTANAAGTSLTLTVPAADLAVANAGNLTVTVTNPKNPTTTNGGGSATATQTFLLVAVNAAQDSSTPGTIAVTAGTPAMVKIDYSTTPANSVLPAALNIACAVPMSLTGAACSVGTPTIAAGATTASSIITINAVPVSNGSSTAGPAFGGRGPWSNYLLWSVVAALLSMLAMTRKFQQRAPQFRRAPIYLALVLLVIGAGVLTGCTTAAKPTPTPTGPSTVTVTATTADGATVTTTVMINVSN